MDPVETIESCVVQLDLPYEELGEGIWVVKDQEETIHNVISLSGPVLVMRIKLADVPDTGREGLYRLLLELNASDMLYGAYGLEGNEVVMTEVMSVKWVDMARFQEAIEGMFMAVTSHHDKITGLLSGKAGASQASDQETR